MTSTYLSSETSVQSIYGLCTFPHTICSAWNILTLFLCLEKSYLTFFFFLELVPGFQRFFLVAKYYLYPMPVYWNKFMNCDYQFTNPGSLYIPFDKCMRLSKWKVWLHFRFHSHGHSNQSNQSSARQWIEQVIFINRTAGGLLIIQILRKKKHHHLQTDTDWWKKLILVSLFIYKDLKYYCLVFFSCFI